MKDKRRFDGKVYTVVGTYPTKGRALNEAESLRLGGSKTNGVPWKVRIVKSGKNYVVYARIK